MNCPQCHGFVGNDQHHVSAWMAVIDCQTGQIVGSTRTISVLCECCGVFEARQNERQSITEITKYSNPRDKRRILRRIPGARFAEVCVA